MPDLDDWRVAGSYFETCNCMAVCPCRRLDGKAGSRSSFGICQFLLTWRIDQGVAGGLDLAGRKVPMAGFYDDDQPGSPWSVVLYIDRDASADQHAALAAIFLGRAGGDLFFTAFIGKVQAVRAAEIGLDHRRGREAVIVRGYASAAASGKADYEGVVSCGIPGHHHPGEEEIAAASVSDGDLAWTYEGRCAFATEYAYASDGQRR